MILLWGLALKLLRGRKKDKRRNIWQKLKNQRDENQRRRQKRNY